MRTKPEKKRKASRSKGQQECSVPGCGRPAYARGLCQTHHRQHLELGRTRAIRPYRPRAANTVKFAGLRLTPHCAATVERYASSKGLARGAAIAELLEQWVKRRKRRRR